MRKEYNPGELKNVTGIETLRFPVGDVKHVRTAESLCEGGTTPFSDPYYLYDENGLLMCVHWVRENRKFETWYPGSPEFTMLSIVEPNLLTFWR